MKRFDSPLKPDGGMEQISWSPDSRWIIYTCRKLHGTEETQSTNSDLYAYEMKSGKRWISRKTWKAMIANLYGHQTANIWCGRVLPALAMRPIAPD